MRQPGIGDEFGRIPGSPRHFAPRYRPPGDPLDRGNHLAHRRAVPGAEIEGDALAALQVIERAHMRVGQVGDMDVIADRRAVRRRIVDPVDLDRIAAAQRGTQHARDQMSFRVVVLADLAICVGARRVEVAQRRIAQIISLGVPVQGPLDRQLGLAIGVERGLRGGLADWHLVRHAVDRAGRREHDRAHAGLAHRSQQRQRAADIIAVVKLGVADRLADIGEGREMHDRSDTVRPHRLDQTGAIVQRHAPATDCRTRPVGSRRGPGPCRRDCRHSRRRR